MQLRSILVGVKPAAPDAHPLRLAADLASRTHARLTALSVAGTSSPGAPVALDLQNQVTMLTAVGIPAIEIARRAESSGADLIVLGRDIPTGRPAPEGGTTAEGTVRRARVPCLLVPRGAGAFHRVLIAVDGGPDSRDLIAAGRLVGRVYGASVRVVQVEEPVTAGVGGPAGPAGPDEFALPAPETIVCRGDPVAEILRVSREGAVDLLVLGHHRGGPVAPHATSGVAARLLQRVPCAVLTVPV